MGGRNSDDRGLPECLPEYCGRIGIHLYQGHELQWCSNVHPTVVVAFRLLMLTGCRKSAISTLLRADVNLEPAELRLCDAKTAAR